MKRVHLLVLSRVLTLALLGPTAALQVAARPERQAQGAPASSKAALAAAATADSGRTPGEAATGARRSPTRRPASGQSAERLPLVLAGRWEDPVCIPFTGPAGGRLYLRRQYAFDEKERRWSLVTDVFRSNRCAPESRLLTYAGRGSYSVTGRSRLGSNVFEAAFTPVAWEVTPTSRDGTVALFNGRCGAGLFDEGLTLDLARSGCEWLALRPPGKASTGLELIRIDGGRMFLGVRQFVRGRIEERPTQLSSYALSRP